MMSKINRKIEKEKIVQEQLINLINKRIDSQGDMINYIIAERMGNNILFFIIFMFIIPIFIFCIIINMDYKKSSKSQKNEKNLFGLYFLPVLPILIKRKLLWKNGREACI